jgi:quinol monooxygenase YgiN
MIIRVFRAKIHKQQVAEFKRLVQTQSIPWLEGAAGLLGYFPGEPLNEETPEFVMITLWRDLAALQAFVGEIRQTPVVTPDETPLVEAIVAHHYRKFDK